MSKIGVTPIKISEKIKIFFNEKDLQVEGPMGKLSIPIPSTLKIEINNGVLRVKRVDDSKNTKALHGLYRQIIANAVAGVEKPWEKILELKGTGYNVKLQGEDLVLKLGYSHPIVFKKVPGIQFKVEGNNKIIVSGVDKQLVGQVAYQIKILKKPDVYKGKGIHFQGEKLRIKPGKKAKTTGETVS